jgi:hypothetical protein
MQIASLLTTVGAHYVITCNAVDARISRDSSLVPLLRSLQEGRRATDAAINIAESFLGSAYANRDRSPALVNDGIRDAMNIALRNCRAEATNKLIDFTPIDFPLPLRGLTGIAFLLMMVPALQAALTLASANTTVGVKGEHLPRVDSVLKDSRWRAFRWLNRRNALTSHNGLMIVLSSSAPALNRAEVDAWCKGEHPPLAGITPRGMIDGIEKCHGMLGLSVGPEAERFQLLLILPH